LKKTLDRLLWFVGLWLAGVAAVGALVYLVRLLIPS
jgi:hypothetical protein